MLADLIGAYNKALVETDKEAAFQVVSEALAEGISPEDVIFKMLIPAIEDMMAVINRDPDANLAQQFMTAQITSDITAKMLAMFSHPPEPVGRVVIGSASGDLHSLGKRIVMGCLKSLMVDVIDLGGNVPAERFVEEALRVDAQVIAISAMMVHTATGPNGSVKVRQILHERGLEDRIKIIVGGAPYRFDPELYKLAGADTWAADGIRAGRAIVDLIKEVRANTGGEGAVVTEAKAS